MKAKILGFFCSLILLSVSVKGQTIDGVLYTQFNNYYKWRGGAFDSTLLLPTVTASIGRRPGALRYNTADSSVYSWTGTQWRKVGDGAAVPTLQQVTTTGNITTDSIISPGYIVDGVTSDFLITEDGAGSGALALKNRQGTYAIVRIGNSMTLKNSTLNTTALLKSETAENYQNNLPDTTGTLSAGVKVNGITYMAGANGITDVGEINMNAGGGSSVNYYLNGSVNQGTFGGTTYYELSKTPVFGAGTNFTRTNGQGDGYIASFITDAGDPGFLNIPSGNWILEFYFQSSSSGGTPAFYGELYKVDTNDVFTLIATGSANPERITNGTAVDQYFTSIAVPQTSLLITDRLAIRVYVITGGRTITLHTEDANLSEVVTTFSTGLTALNGLTSQVQNFTTGTTGTDFNISSSTSTHTFNLPTASATNRGALSSADWSDFNNKISRTDTVPLAVFGAGSGAAGDTAAFTTSALYGSFYNAGNDTLIITQMRAGVLGTSPSITTEVYWNDSLNITAGATILVSGGTSVTGTIGATNVTSFTNNKIPPNVWVFVRTSAVATKPTYFTLTLLGYKKRI
jgi:hypothetical protein